MKKKKEKMPPSLDIAPTRAPKRASSPPTSLHRGRGGRCRRLMTSSPQKAGNQGLSPSLHRLGGPVRKRKNGKNSRSNRLDDHLGLGSVEEPGGPDCGYSRCGIDKEVRSRGTSEEHVLEGGKGGKRARGCGREGKRGGLCTVQVAGGGVGGVWCGCQRKNRELYSLVRWRGELGGRWTAGSLVRWWCVLT